MAAKTKAYKGFVSHDSHELFDAIAKVQFFYVSCKVYKSNLGRGRGLQNESARLTFVLLVHFSYRDKRCTISFVKSCLDRRSYLVSQTRT
jgi:hypothetical protein